jgi:hypothetical protein
MKRHTKVALMIGGIVIVTLCIVNHIALLSPAGLIGLIMAAVGLFARRDYPRVRRYPSPQPPPLQSDVVSQPLRTTPPQPALQTPFSLRSHHQCGTCFRPFRQASTNHNTTIISAACAVSTNGVNFFTGKRAAKSRSSQSRWNYFGGGIYYKETRFAWYLIERA